MRFNKFKLAVSALFTRSFSIGFRKSFRHEMGFIEVSSQWVPYAIHDFARRFERQGRAVDKSAVLRKNKIWVACQTDDDLPYVLKYSGDDMLVIGTDYGHNDTSSEILALRKLKKTAPCRPTSSTRSSTTTPGAVPGSENSNAVQCSRFNVPGSTLNLELGTWN